MSRKPAAGAPQRGIRARIRRARPTDAAAILELERHFPGDRLSPRSVRNFLAGRPVSVWMAEVAGEPAGNLVLLLRKGSRRARIYSVVVGPQARGQGLGRRLVRAAEAAAGAAGRVLVTLEVRADNVAAQALYAGLGYRCARRLPAYYEDGGDGLRLEKKVDARTVRQRLAVRRRRPRGGAGAG